MKISALLVASLALLMSFTPTIAFEPEEGPVEDTWARTDLPVSDGLVFRTWMWGPDAISGPLVEPYEEAPGGSRPVQYFDKARMEITNPAADPDSIWYVTNGLLVVEMVTGRLQVGDVSFEARDPAEVGVAGDNDDVNGPTYATFLSLLDTPPLPFDRPITQTINPAGEVGSDNALAAANIQVAVIDQVTGHTIPEPFWAFMNSSGIVFEDGEFVTDQIFENPYFATGRPITEPYWAEVKVAGAVKWVLVQPFERRVLTYTPDNPPGWQVEAGNVGRHYFEWRYTGESEPPPEPDPTPTPSPPGQTIEIDVDGIEVDFGETVGDTTFGLRFIGTASGDAGGAIEVSIDYTPPNPGPSVVNVIVGGSWSIASLDGSISGTIPSGSATWDKDVSQARVEATFVISAASGEFSGYAGEGAFNGILSHDFFPPRIGGTLVFSLE